MENPEEQNETSVNTTPNKFEGLLWMILVVLILSLGAVLLQRNWQKVIDILGIQGPLNFDEVTVTNGFHDVSLKNGQAYDISYETSRERKFSGLVRHTSAITEPNFAILTFDILVTSGDFSNSDLVQTSVSNHHFTWMTDSEVNPQGTINLLHTVPMNQKVNQALKSIQNGDSVIITGYDVDRIDGFDKQGKYIGYWTDSGCNTTLVTNVQIINND